MSKVNDISIAENEAYGDMVQNIEDQSSTPREAFKEHEVYSCSFEGLIIALDEVTDLEICEQCNGWGHIGAATSDMDPSCPTCDGEGCYEKS